MEFLLLLALPLLALAFAGGGDDAGQDGETIEGSEANDSLVGDIGDDLISGLDGSDTLDGRAGDDTLIGGAGNDILDGGFDDDSVMGGDGNDVVLGYTGDDTLQGGRGHDLVLGEEGNDLIQLGWGNDQNWLDDESSAEAFSQGQLGDDSVYGGAGNDSIWDYSGTNLLDGGDGNDMISASDDQLEGWQTAGHSSDIVKGGAGDDRLWGDDGDTLSGGDGDDSFNVAVLRDNDKPAVITDFDGAHDSLSLSVDETLATADAWQIYHTTDAETGKVTIGVVNKTDATKMIELAILQNPVGFDISNVALTLS